MGVWVGYDDDRSLHMTGASAALPIVARFLSEATTDDDWSSFDVPEGITEAQAGGAERDVQSECGSREYFLTGTEPAQTECAPFEMPDLNRMRDWGKSLEDRARQLLEKLVSKQLQYIRRNR